MIKEAYSRKIKVQKREDPYRPPVKYPLATQCVDCGAVFYKGRWVPGAKLEKPVFHGTVCSACLRKKERMPAGSIEVNGDFYQTHKNEVTKRILNIEKQEKGRHPLERIMTSREAANGVMLDTTGIHLARRIGKGLFRSFKGRLSLSYGPGEERILVRWVR